MFGLGHFKRNCPQSQEGASQTESKSKQDSSEAPGKQSGSTSATIKAKDSLATLSDEQVEDILS